jgi:hypothetical protein
MVFIRRFFLFVAIFSMSAAAIAQSAIPAADRSPLDVSYYPASYPLLKIQDKAKEGPVARVVYSRPAKEKRKIYGGIVEYGKVWRMGANEATEIEFYKDVTINGKKVAKGRYTIYAIVEEKDWTFIINTDTDCWGAFKYDARKDVVRMQVPAIATTEPVELLSMYFENTAQQINFVVAWDNYMAKLPIKI